MGLNIRIHFSPEVMALLGRLAKQQEQIIMDLAALTSAVEANTSAEASAIRLIEQIATDLRNAAGDQAAVNALADQLSSSAAQLGAAVTANTPAAAEPAQTPDAGGAPTGDGGTPTDGGTPDGAPTA